MAGRYNQVVFHTEEEFTKYWDIELCEVQAAHEDEFENGRVSFKADYGKLPQRIKNLLFDVHESDLLVGSVKESYPATFYVTW